MAYELQFGVLTAAQKTDAADLLQKLESLNGALADMQTERAALDAKINEKTSVISKEKDTVIDALRALRLTIVKESA
jgi:uncharacterized protein YlxW (UPF0749 family)